MTLPTSKSYASGHFELAIDGHKSTAFLKSVDGGFVRGGVVDDPVGAGTLRVKHLSTVDIEPISVEFGLTGAQDVLSWIQDSWARKFSRRNGQITHGDFDLYQTFQHEFYDALITETQVPTLDGSAKDGGYLKCKIQPERIKTTSLPGGSGPRLSGTQSPKQKLWSPSCFRFNIDTIDGMQYTNKLDSFTIKQGVKKLYTGNDRFPQIEPTKIEFPNLSGTIALKFADGLMDWYQQYVVQGIPDHEAQKTGSIEFLAPDKASTICRINLFQVGIHYASIEPSSANQDSIKRVKFELYVGRMEMDGGTGFS